MDNAQLLLGTLYATGKGVPQDNRSAYAWLDLASTSSNTEIREAAQKMRDSVGAHMTPTDMAAARDLAKRFASKYAVVH